ncbi:hypothetical protein, partial [Mycoplasmopsis bovis]|uniref:hypothetical protein n=1 Tax=Mycoplasmopsis bovis TaxID=28903 RepID=UPI003D27FBDC
PSSYNEEYINNINANTNDDVKQEDSVKNNSSLDPNEANNHIHDQFRINNIASSSGVIDINNRSVHNIERKDNKNELKPVLAWLSIFIVSFVLLLSSFL